MHAHGFGIYCWLRRAGIAALVATVAACGQADSNNAAADVKTLPEVVVAQATQRAVPLALSYTAQTVGSREVEVRARVSGILLKRLYQEGAPVKQGDLLFQIDPAPFEAVVAEDRAALAVTRANQTQARRNRDRILPLVDKGLASPKERDDVLSSLEVADAQLQAAEASLRTAELNLSYTKVRAPISGITSREARSEGSLITADTDSSLLTRIVQLQPLYVEFAAPEQEAALLRSAWARQAKQQLPVRIELQTEQVGLAHLSFIDNMVDPHSGTVRMRAVLDNRNSKLWPGQYLRVHIDGLNLASAIAIPRRAVLSSAQGYSVWVVDSEHSAQAKSVKLGVALGDEVLINEGLQIGDNYVLDGMFKLQPGTKVKPVTAVASQKTSASTSSGSGEKS